MAAFGEGNVLHCDIALDACIQPQCAAAEVPVAGDTVLHHSKTRLRDKSAVIGCLIFHFPSNKKILIIPICRILPKQRVTDKS